MTWLAPTAQPSNGSCIHDGVISELDVIIIDVRAEQAAEYERLFAERELPRWRDYKARGAFLSARISRVAFGTDNRRDVAKYAIAVEVPSHERGHKRLVPRHASAYLVDVSDRYIDSIRPTVIG